MFFKAPPVLEHFKQSSQNGEMREIEIQSGKKYFLELFLTLLICVCVCACACVCRSFGIGTIIFLSQTSDLPKLALKILKLVFVLTGCE